MIKERRLVGEVLRGLCTLLERKSSKLLEIQLTLTFTVSAYLANPQALSRHSLKRESSPCHLRFPDDISQYSI